MRGILRCFQGYRRFIRYFFILLKPVLGLMLPYFEGTYTSQNGFTVIRSPTSLQLHAVTITCNTNQVAKERYKLQDTQSVICPTEESSTNSFQILAASRLGLWLCGWSDLGWEGERERCSLDHPSLPIPGTAEYQLLQGTARMTSAQIAWTAIGVNFTRNVFNDNL